MKKQIKTYAITLAVAVAIMIGVSALRGAFTTAFSPKEAIRCACDAFFVTGILYLCVGGIIWASKMGTFDGFGYSFSLWKQRYTNNKRDWRNEESFYDYKERKAEKKKGRQVNHVLIVGAVFVMIAAILLLVFHFG